MKLPDQIVDKKPSADLWAGQTDEEELGFTYKEADEVLALLIDSRMKPEHVVDKGYNEKFVEQIMQTVRKTQYKRHLPLIAKLSTRTINRDFRFPRDWGL